MPLIFCICFILLNQFCWSQSFIEEARFGRLGNRPGEFKQPLAISISDKELIYVVDTGNHRIQLFDLSGNLLKTVGGFGFEVDQFDRPVDIWVESIINNYVSDYNNERVQRYDGNMNFLSSLISNEGDVPEFQFSEVASCAINSQKDLFLLDRGDNKIIKINRNGQKERAFGAYESGEGDLQQPQQLDMVAQKYLIVSDLSRRAVLKYDFFGNYLGNISSADFIGPSGLCVSKHNEIFIADPLAKKIFMVSADQDTIKILNSAMTRPLQKPQDMDLFERRIGDQTETKLFIIDNNEIIIGKLIYQ